ncbi:stage II sporulation protein P [Sporomusa sp.]|uniref:stage II sporulation protein P n=1 Tax=Sporomusa sp. TaxID=2078658 RepID=UPI002BCC8FDE|nr:stage II sporulation protein P [Sporomusa sp.]HWR43469.1 stage II sporulation protein P [Sporomusa sp.]
MKNSRFFCIPRSVLAIASILLAVSLGLYVTSRPAPEQKPLPSPQPQSYTSYLILEETTGETLMQISVPPTVGDELITDTNKRYTIVKVEENRSYARFVEDVNLKKYQNPK